MTILDTVLKSRDISLLQRSFYSKLWFFQKSFMDVRVRPWIRLNIHLKDRWWSSNTLAIWCEKPTHWKRSWCWETLRAGRERSEREIDGWTASLTQWTWVWWRTGKSGVLLPMGLVQLCCKESDTTALLNNNNQHDSQLRPHLHWTKGLLFGNTDERQVSENRG